MLERTSLEAPPRAVERLKAALTAVAASPRPRVVEPRPSVANEAMNERPCEGQRGHW